MYEGQQTTDDNAIDRWEIRTTTTKNKEKNTATFRHIDEQFFNNMNINQIDMNVNQIQYLNGYSIYIYSKYYGIYLKQKQTKKSDVCVKHVHRIYL